MNKRPIFQEVMQTIFVHMGITLPEDMQKEVYVADIGEAIRMYFFCDRAEFLSIVCYVGPIPNNAPESMLFKLLAVNNFEPAYPNLNVGVNEETRMVEVWVRQRLSVLNEREGEAEELFALALRAVERVTDILGMGSSSEAVPNTALH